MTLVPDLHRHVFYLTVCAISTQERDDALLDILDAFRCMEIVEGFAFEREDVDLEAGVIHIRRSWDPHAGPIEPKSRAGRRRARTGLRGAVDRFPAEQFVPVKLPYALAGYPSARPR